MSGDSFRFLGSSLVGKSLCWFDEVDAKRTEMGNSLGTLITGKTLNIERKGVDRRIEARNKIKCVLTANSLPHSLEHGMFRRLILINFTRSFYDEGIIDNQLEDVLQTEASGILNRMLKGLKDLHDMRGFTVIAGHEDLVEEYKNASDPISGFLSTYFEPVAGEEVSASELFEAYKTYRVGDNFTKSLTPQKFGMMMRVQPLTAFSKITSKKYNTGNRWVGLRLKKEYKFNNYGMLELVNF
jgi:phage/plasmid-associated DNA primase